MGIIHMVWHDKPSRSMKASNFCHLSYYKVFKEDLVKQSILIMKNPKGSLRNINKYITLRLAHNHTKPGNYSSQNCPQTDELL